MARPPTALARKRMRRPTRVWTARNFTDLMIRLKEAYIANMRSNPRIRISTWTMNDPMP